MVYRVEDGDTRAIEKERIADFVEFLEHMPEGGGDFSSLAASTYCGDHLSASGSLDAMDLRCADRTLVDVDRCASPANC